MIVLDASALMASSNRLTLLPTGDGTPSGRRWSAARSEPLPSPEAARAEPPASPCRADVALLTQADTRPQRQGSMLLSLDPTNRGRNEFS